MSYQAISAALGLTDLAVGERLSAFALASYANHAHFAWPAPRTAAARAGLSRRQYLVARDRLAVRGLIALEHVDRQSVARLLFAEQGASIGREVNPQRFEAVLDHDVGRGGARVLMAVLAALSDAEGLVRGLGSEELADVCGLSDRTYRRARRELLAASQIVIEHSGGGRGRCNVWRVVEHGAIALEPARKSRRSAPAPGQMPLIAVVRSDQTHSARQTTARRAVRRPAEASRRTNAKNAVTNPSVNPGQNCTPRLSETPAKTPAETPAPHARTGKESQKQRTPPPDPPEGGQRAATVIESYVTDSGRTRTRRISVDPTIELAALTDTDHELWTSMQELLRTATDAATREIWLSQLSPIAVARRDSAVLLAGPVDLHRWIRSRHERLFLLLSQTLGRPVRLADDRELALHNATGRCSALAALPHPISLNGHDQQEAI